jgi:anti-sigma regulatory factor (Ser/Thr protein kinase)
MTQGARREFPLQATAVREARAFVLGSPHTLGCDPDDLALAVSEVVSNAVLHARTAFTVLVHRGARSVRITVSDGSALLPRVQRVDDGGITGRGMRIVERVALNWGAVATPSGKDVWFELECKP